jgi:hypothetical protein
VVRATHVPVRMVLAAGLAATIAVPAAADARQRSCHMIRDAEGDVRPASSRLTQEQDVELDVLSADIGIDAAQVTVVIRVARLTEPDPARTDGRNYGFQFSVKERVFAVIGDLMTGGSEYTVDLMSGPRPGNEGGAQSGQVLGFADGVVDVKKGEIRMTAKTELFAPYAALTRGTAVYNMSVDSGRSTGVTAGRVDGVPLPIALAVGVRDVGGQDYAGDGSDYRVGAPSCALLTGR